jgi:hypothetical protein
MSELSSRIKNLIDIKVSEIFLELRQDAITKTQIKNQILKLMEKKSRPKKRTKKIVRPVVMVSDSSDDER